MKKPGRCIRCGQRRLLSLVEGIIGLICAQCVREIRAATEVLTDADLNFGGDEKTQNGVQR